MWIGQVVKGRDSKQHVVITRPESFDILEGALNTPDLRHKLIDAALASDAFDWQAAAVELGVNPENIERILFGQPPSESSREGEVEAYYGHADHRRMEVDVLIRCCVDAVMVAEEFGLTIEFIPAIADRTRVSLTVHGDRLQVAISAPESSTRIPTVLTRSWHYDALEAYLNDADFAESNRLMVLGYCGPGGEGWRAMATQMGISEWDLDDFERNWPQKDAIIDGAVEAIKRAGLLPIYFRTRLTGEGAMIDITSDSCVVTITDQNPAQTQLT